MNTFEDSLQRAVQCCVDPSVPPGLRSQAIEYLTQVKSAAGSWRLLIDFYYQCPGATVESKFFALQATEETVRQRHMSPEDIAVLRGSLLVFLSKDYAARSQLETGATRNKFAQIIVGLFGAGYLSTWQSFFDDLIPLLDQGPPLVDMFLRIMRTIDDDLISRTILRSDAEALHATQLKDAMRERDIVRVVDVWYNLLVQYYRDHPDLATQCLDVVKVYVEWIDVNLIVSKRFVDALFTFLNNMQLREAACECVNEIVLKGMKPLGKIQLVQALQLPRILTEFVEATPDQYDRFLLKVAHLFNDLGVVLAGCWAELGEGELTTSSGGPSTPSGRSVPQMPANAATVTNASAMQARQAQEDCYTLLAECLPAVFRLLGSENENVARTVSPFTQALLGIYKQEKRSGRPLAQPKEQSLAQLLRVLIGRLQYSDDLGLALPDNPSGTADGDEESEFEQLRKMLKAQVETIAALDDALVYTLVSDICMQAMADLRSQGLARIELVLYLLNLLGDSVRGQIKYVRDPAVNAEGSRPVEVRLSALLAAVIASDIAACPNAVIQMSYMDTLVRFSRYFEVVPEVLDSALRAFLDARGLHHSNQIVRGHAMRQFVKFVRALKPRLQPQIGTILNMMQDLLNVTATIAPANSAYSGQASPTLSSLQTVRRRRSSSFSDQGMSWFTEQLNLFETAGMLISHELLDSGERVRLVQALLSPILDLMQRTLKQGLYKLDTEDNPFHILSLHHAIFAVGAVAKGFPVHAGQVGGWENTFTACLQLTLATLDSLPDIVLIKEAARFQFQRLVPAVGKEILPLLAPSVVRLLRDAQMRDVIDFVPLLSQLIYRFKADIATVLDEVITELLERVFGFFGAMTTNGTHVPTAAIAVAMGTAAGNSYEALLMIDLKKAYLSLLLAILNNDVGPVFTTERNRRHLDAMLSSVIQMASSLDNDVQVVKLSIMALMKMVDVFTFSGFEDFALERILPIPFLLPSSPSFNAQDAQTALLVVNELAALQRHVVLRFGQRALDLVAGQLAFIGLQPPAVQEYLQAVVASDPKVIKNYYRAILSGRK